MFSVVDVAFAVQNPLSDSHMIKPYTYFFSQIYPLRGKLPAQFWITLL